MHGVMGSVFRRASRWLLLLTALTFAVPTPADANGSAADRLHQLNLAPTSVSSRIVETQYATPISANER